MILDRRNFVQLSASATTAMLLSSLSNFAVPIKNTTDVGQEFELKILGTNWGFPGTLNEYTAKVKQEGYDGIEIWWPMQKEEQTELFTALKKYDLEVGFLCGAQHSNYKEHIDFFKKMIDAAATNNVQRPLYINCHSGRDYFTYEENKSFIDHTTSLAKSTGIIICHETHRSRMLFAAPVAKQYIEKNPELRVTFDVSHWCNVSESLLHDQKETVDLALARADHIHARIGHPEGPQVNDPRAPEWDDAVKAHVAWWDKVIERKKQNGERMTILTEFGPADYMPTVPYTRKPLSDQWEVNVYMMAMLRKRYQS